MNPESTAPPLWRRLLRDAATLLQIGLYTAIAAPTVATVLLALRANGLGFELLYAVIIAPWAMVLAGPGAFLLGVVFGWMLIGLVRMGRNTLASRVGLAVVVATVAWWLAEPLAGATSGGAASEGAAGSALGDWLSWSVSAAVSALVFTRGWLAFRVRPADKESDV